MNLFRDIFSKNIIFIVFFLFLSFPIYIRYGVSFTTVEYTILTLIMLWLSSIDIKTMKIPDIVNAVGFIAAVIIMIIKALIYNGSITSHILGLLVGGGFFLIIALLTKGAMGGGDIKLMAVLGLWMGFENIILIIILSFFISAVISVFLLASKKKKKEDHIPFGPFIAVAVYLTILYGSEIWRFIYI